MDAQRRYELKVALDRLSAASNELRGLADEEEAAFNSTPLNCHHSSALSGGQEPR